MIKGNLFYNNVTNNSLIEYKCPSCGNQCDEKSLKCNNCCYNLKDYKSIILSKYYYFNDAVDLSINKKYFNALLAISKFLAFNPDNQMANELYIYLLHKNNKNDEYREELDKFEERFKYSSFIKNVEMNGIDNYKIPPKYELDFKFNNNSFDELTKLYVENRYKTINEISEFGCRLFDIKQFYLEKKHSKPILDFYDKSFLSFLSKFELSFTSSDGKKYDELSDKEKNFIEVIGNDTKSNKRDGTIITISPAVFIRTKLISKEKVTIVKNDRRWF